MAKTKLSNTHALTPDRAVRQNITPQGYWVLGCEELEEFALSFCANTVLNASSETLRLLANGTRAGYLSRQYLIDYVNRPVASGLPSSKVDADRVEFFARKLIKACAFRSEAMWQLNPSLYAVVNSISTQETFNRWKPTHCLTFSGYSPNTSLYSGRDNCEVKLISFKEDSKYMYFRNHGNQVAYRQQEFVNTDLMFDRSNIRIPKHVMHGSMSREFIFLIPNMQVWIELFTTIYDWMGSDDAPKNITKLDPADAIKKAKKWHEGARYPIGATRYDHARRTMTIRTRTGWVEVTDQNRARITGSVSGHALDYIGAGTLVHMAEGQFATVRRMPDTGWRVVSSGRSFSRNEASTRDSTEKPREVEVIDVEMFGRKVTFAGAHPGTSDHLPNMGPAHPVAVSDADYTLLWEKGDWKVLVLETWESFQRESQIMHHCIGNSTSYYQRKKDPGAGYRALSLRYQGRAVATCDYYHNRGFSQLKGQANKVLSPVASVAFLEFLGDVYHFGINYTSDNGDLRLLVTSNKKIEGAIQKDSLHGSEYDMKTYLQLHAIKNLEVFGEDSFVHALMGKQANPLKDIPVMTENDARNLVDRHRGAYPHQIAAMDQLGQLITDEIHAEVNRYSSQVLGDLQSIPRGTRVVTSTPEVTIMGIDTAEAELPSIRQEAYDQLLRDMERSMFGQTRRSAQVEMRVVDVSPRVPPTEYTHRTLRNSTENFSGIADVLRVPKKPKTWMNEGMMSALAKKLKLPKRFISGGHA